MTNYCTEQTARDFAKWMSIITACQAVGVIGIGTGIPQGLGNWEALNITQDAVLVRLNSLGLVANTVGVLGGTATLVGGIWMKRHLRRRFDQRLFQMRFDP